WESLRGLLQALHQALPPPDQTLSLRAFEERMYRIWAERATEEAERAIGLGMHGVALSALGRREEALQATEEAVALYRRLTQQHPQAFLPDLARSLTDLGARLSKVGRFEEAIQATEEAVRLFRQLTDQHPQAFLPDLARSLVSLGARLSKVSRFEEALQATEEAVRLLRQLADQHPQAFLPNLARSLNSLGL
ncbi:MAG: tetratricopeptide repeat protein, partial [Anaerolineae bacterium]|uniref:tetratricopeptide repeat protein n=1 Tax=Thermoflexus sp. TaxID=1969742 RepID=UPI0025FDF5EC